MPAKLIARKQEHQPSAEQEQAAPVAQRPLPEADEAVQEAIPDLPMLTIFTRGQVRNGQCRQKNN